MSSRESESVVSQSEPVRQIQVPEDIPAQEVVRPAVSTGVQHDVEQPQISAERPAAQRRPQPRPVAVWTLIAMNVLVWLAMTLVGGSANRAVLLAFGAKANDLIVKGEVWRFVTPIFIHIGLLHLVFNTYALYIFGPQIEQFFGTLRFVIIYLLSGIYGVLLSFAFSPHLSAGASGAIFGLIGTEAVFFYRYRNTFGRPGRQRFYNLLIVIGYNLVFTFTVSNIDVWGHLGGLAAGAILGWYLMPHYAVAVTEHGPRLLDNNRPRQWGSIAAAAFALLILGAWVAIRIQAAGMP